MKTTIFNITAAALLIASSFIAGKSTLKSDLLELPSSALIENTELMNNSYSMVEAKIVNGEVIPVVQLPELTISGSYSKTNMVHAELVDGEVMPVVYLPELTITSN
jgi:hypothetical protein